MKKIKSAGEQLNISQESFERKYKSNNYCVVRSHVSLESVVLRTLICVGEILRIGRNRSKEKRRDGKSFVLKVCMELFTRSQ
jgi:hypothetical protein